MTLSNKSGRLGCCMDTGLLSSGNVVSGSKCRQVSFATGVGAGLTGGLRVKTGVACSRRSQGVIDRKAQNIIGSTVACGPLRPILSVGSACA